MTINQAYKKPLRFTECQNGENYGKAIELSEGNNWEHTFTELPVPNNGVAYKYTVEENRSRRIY